MNSRAKGQRGERELADFLTAAGFPARRGQQFAGGPGSPDVVCDALGFHVEAKRTERLNLDSACAQAERDAGGCKPWAVFHRRNRTGWRVTLGADAFLALMAHTRPQQCPPPVSDPAEGRNASQTPFRENAPHPSTKPNS